MDVQHPKVKLHCSFHRNESLLNIPLEIGVNEQAEIPQMSGKNLVNSVV